MDRAMIIFDVSNLYSCAIRNFSAAINYKELIARLGEGFNVVKKVALGANLDGSANGFWRALQYLGCHTDVKPVKVFADKRKADCDVGICVLAMAEIDTFDTLILCSADGDLSPMINHLRSKGKTVRVYGIGISKELHEAANYCEELTEKDMMHGTAKIAR